MALAAITLTGSVAMIASGESANVELPTDGSPTTLVVTNLGQFAAFIALGDQDATATDIGYPVLPGAQVVVAIDSATHLAAITLGAESRLVVTAGT